MSQLPTYDDVAAARTRIAGRIVRTPMLRNPLLDQLTGATVLIKPEPLQRTGSFKFRGATNAALRLGEDARRAGVVTHSSGNHGQATAAAAAAVGAHATVFMPADAPRIKVESTRRWGADIVHYDRLKDDRDALAWLGRALSQYRWLAVTMAHKESGRDSLRERVRNGGLRDGLLALTTDPEAYDDRFEDAGAALHWARTQCRAGPSVLVGHSMGAVTVMIEAGAKKIGRASGREIV